MDNSYRTKNRGRVPPSLRTWGTALAVALTIASSHVAASGDITPPPVPANLEVPDGNAPFLIGHAYGTQNYICLLAPEGFAWTFLGPQATLFDEDDSQITTHFLSPNPIQGGAARATWQHSGDSSTVWAAAIASTTDPAFVAPGAIPWLLLKVVGADDGPASGDALTATTFIHRVNTLGGIAPATGCSRAADVGTKAFVPYTTDYIFYSKK